MSNLKAGATAQQIIDDIIDGAAENERLSGPGTYADWTDANHMIDTYSENEEYRDNLYSDADLLAEVTEAVREHLAEMKDQTVTAEWMVWGGLSDEQAARAHDITVDSDEDDIEAAADKLVQAAEDNVMIVARGDHKTAKEALVASLTALRRELRKAKGLVRVVGGSMEPLSKWHDSEPEAWRGRRDHRRDLRRDGGARPLPNPALRGRLSINPRGTAQAGPTNPGSRKPTMINQNTNTACKICGKPLSDPISVETGMGPICRIGLKAAAADNRTLDLFGNRPCYTCELVGDVICIVDLDRGGKSVTNDAENVIEDLVADGYDLSKLRVIYKDTLGIWDELVVRDGRFAGFKSINERSRDAALGKIRRVAA
ncbi:DUF6011 domain-containing protein [Microvirga sp. G4-2]|uniref:DUF6011 domain-containing protein n=1 Tax=Microvirga sp. G4-2 TaxID=3434467 RepID=UPI0040442A8F